MHHPPGRLACFLQGLEKNHPIRVILENGIQVIPAIHDMINRPSKFNPGSPWHGELMPIPTQNVKD